MELGVIESFIGIRVSKDWGYFFGGSYKKDSIEVRCFGDLPNSSPDGLVVAGVLVNS